MVFILNDMDASSTCTKEMHCIPIDANPFSHYNLIQIIDPFSMPSLLLITILVNNNPH